MKNIFRIVQRLRSDSVIIKDEKGVHKVVPGITIRGRKDQGEIVELSYPCQELPGTILEYYKEINEN